MSVLVFAMPETLVGADGILRVEAEIGEPMAFVRLHAGPDPRFAQLVAPGTQGDPAAHAGHGWGGWRWRVDQLTVDGVDVGLAGRVLGAGESAVVGGPVVGRVVVAVLTNVSAHAAYFQASWDVEYLQ